MITMAIDASSKSTGVAIFKDKELVARHLIAAAGTDSLARIKKMVSEIEILYKAWNVDAVIMEDVIPADVHNNLNVFKTLHYLQAALVLMFHNHEQKVEFYVSSEWRKKCGIRTGRGITRDMVKAADIKFVKDNYGIDVNDDVADAICIGYAYTQPKAATTSAIRESAF